MVSELRPPAVAGSFYPAAPARLRADVDALLAAVPAEPAQEAPKALIVPHAGYIYSGPVAATAYARLVPFAERFQRVVIVGPAHRAYFQGVALPESAVFDTPLGPVPIDAAAIPLIPDAQRIEGAHAREHSLEVQLPFLSRVLQKSFKIVPIVAGATDGEEVAEVLDALWGGPETLIVVSSDLSHYLPYDEAKRVDEGTAKRIESLSERPINHDQACGATPVNGLMIVARRRGLRVERLDVRNSGDTAGSRDQVVGYGAFALYEGARHVS